MGLAGDRIPEFARVIAVADAFDSMTTTRSYRGARTLEAAVAELRRCAGTQFDPAMVEALVRGLDEHGWEPETVPVFTAPEPDEVFDQDAARLRPRRPDQLAGRGAVMTSIRRRLDDAGTMGFLVVVASATLLAIIAVVVTASPGGFVDTRLALAFGAFIAFGELMRITLPGGRDAAPIGTAGALAYVLLTRVPGDVADHSALQVVAVVVVAMLVGMAPHVVVGRAPALDSAGPPAAQRRCRPPRSSAVPAWTSASTVWRGPALAMVLVGVVLATLVVDAVLAAAVRAGADGAPFSAVLRNEVRAQIGIGSAIGATGALIALAATIMNLWALPVFVVPLLLTQFAFRRYAAIRQSTRQTIRALSKVTELGGLTEAGHSDRVTSLSLAVGKELGMSDAELLDLEYAAQMHDIGQLSLPEPILAGATVFAAPTEQRNIAMLSAEIIKQTGVLDGVAAILAQQAEPYRRAHERGRLDVPLAARIIKAVNAYDDLVGNSYEPGARLDALERLRLGMAYEYDPMVVDSLSKTVERTARLGG